MFYRIFKILEVKVKSVSRFSRIQLFATPWTTACQAPLSMGFSRQECWSGLPFPPPGDLPDSGTEPRSPALQVDSSVSEPPERYAKFLSIPVPLTSFQLGKYPSSERRSIVFKTPFKISSNTEFSNKKQHKLWHSNLDESPEN